MKKLNFKLLTALLGVSLIAGIIFFACKKIEKGDAQRNASIQEFVKLAQEGAQIHNEALEYVYDELLKMDRDKLSLDVALNVSLDFIKTKSFFQYDLDGVIDAFKKESIKAKKTRTDRKNIWHDEDEQLLSNQQKSWLNQIQDIIDTNEDDLSQMAVELDKISDAVIKNGTDEDIIILIVSIEIIKVSMNYWYNHLSEWENLMSDGGGAKGKLWEKVKSAAVGDFAGGLGGMVGGAITGGLTGALAGGVGAAPGAIIGALGGGVGGAITGSVTGAIVG